MMEKSYTSFEDQYQTVNIRRTKDDNNITTTSTVEEILKKIVPAKSFLYRNNDKKTDRTISSYLPMDTGTPKKPRRFFRTSLYEYPLFSSKSTKSENFNDRGYYSVKTNSRYCIQKTLKLPEVKNKYKSISTPDSNEKEVIEDHLYEDLCYNDVEKTDTDKKDQAQKPYKVKIQELFQSFKLPFFKRNEEVEEEVEEIKEVVEKEKESNIYENGDIDIATNMYDSVQAVRPVEVKRQDRVKIPVEDYLEPIQVDREHQYCDVEMREDSLLQYIMSLFESFGMRRVVCALAQNLSARFAEATVLCCCHMLHCLTDVVTETNEDHSEDSEAARKQPSAPEAEVEWTPKTNMADRPLPVPVENEPYYMNIDRCEAENLLKGEPDGTFILRPSSQPNHAFTLSVSCTGGVYNIGVRRRSDGRLALGYARRAARSFPSVAALLRHHRRRRLLLVAGGGVVGATTLNEPPRYYQAPSSIPVPLHTVTTQNS